MTEIGEGVASISKPGKAKKLVGCDWKDCQKNHEKKVPYPGGGVLSRSSGFAAAWVAAGLEPWVKYGAGIDTRPTLDEYRAETPKASYAVLAAAMPYPAYHTQKHHLISINLFKDVPSLKHNAQLVSYDVNGLKNGVCLPTYELDIARHDLQAHRGSHPNNLYNAKIKPLLRQLEKRAVKYCHLESGGDCAAQKDLVKDLDALSARVEQQIKAWRWLLRSDALAERFRSHERMKNLKQGSL